MPAEKQILPQEALLLMHDTAFGDQQLTVVIPYAGSLSSTDKDSAGLEHVIAAIRAIALRSVQVRVRNNAISIVPTTIYVASTGRISRTADERLRQASTISVNTLDANRLIAAVDKTYPQYWLGLDVDEERYQRKLNERLVSNHGGPKAQVVLAPQELLNAVTDNRYVELYLYTTVPRRHITKGKVEFKDRIQQLPATKIITRNDRLVLILGSAGTGKSTLLRRIAFDLTTRALAGDRTTKTPLIVRAADLLTANCVDLLDCLIRAYADVMDGTTDTFPIGKLSEGKVVILIDGLDEVGSDSGKAITLDHILAFHQRFPECQVVVASRDLVALEKPEWQPFKKYRLQPINLRQAEKVLDRVRSTVPMAVSASTNDLLRRLDAYAGMLSPLLVAVCAVTAEETREDLPPNVTELFKKYTELMLGRWDTARDLGKQYHAPLKDHILRHIAYNMHSARARSISLDDFKRGVSEYVSRRAISLNVDDLADEMLNRSGLLRLILGEVEFTHHQLQEFFAGRGIPNERLIPLLITDEWWRIPIVFFFGDHVEARAEELISYIGSLQGKPAEEQWVATVTLGLVLQACYLTEADTKQDFIAQLIRSLASLKSKFESAVDEAGEYPGLTSLIYYVSGREAVSLSAISGFVEVLAKQFSLDPAPAADLEMFWLIIGLIETRHLELARELAWHFRPSDGRLGMSIDFACAFMEQTRSVSKEEMTELKSIRSRISTGLQYYRRELLQEIDRQRQQLPGEVLAGKNG
jgi:hypothetical protein